LRDRPQGREIGSAPEWHPACQIAARVAERGETPMRVMHLILMSALAAACGGGDDDGGGGGGGGSSELDACAIVTQADAEGLFGQSATTQDGAEVVDPALLGECIWYYEAADASNEMLAIYVWDNASGNYYNAADGSDPYDLGDEAYILIDDTTGIDIGWRQDDLAVYLEFFTIGPMVPEAVDKTAEVEALAAQASARLTE
jgi:hypothetical protein